MIKSIDKNEALRYLGCKGHSPDSRIAALLDICEKELLQVIKPAFLYSVYDIYFTEKGVQIADSDLFLTGNDVNKHLQGCNKAVLLCATLGNAVDMLIRSQQITDMGKAMITDALASVAIEQLCDIAEKEIIMKTGAEYYTYRYSAGYGDLPIDIQERFLSLLSAQKKIGLCVNDSMMLTPIKSVTAFIGLSDNEIKQHSRDCECCNFKEKCKYRKDGVRCGY